MDLQRAIAKIDPKSTYLLNHSQADDMQAILEWRGPGAQPSQMMLEDAWKLCLEDDLAESLQELERLEAIERIKADTQLADVAKVLRL